MKRKHTLVVVAILGGVLFAAFSSLPGVQAADTPQDDLSPQVRIFSNYSKDFRALEDSLHGEDLQAVQFLDSVSTTAEDRLHAAKAMLDMYGNILCKPDRERVRPILKEQLDMYSWMMDHEADRTAGFLQFAKVPAAAQLGLRMKDDLRAAKSKLYELAASLK
jgi:hypothetical protein